MTGNPPQHCYTRAMHASIDLSPTPLPAIFGVPAQRHSLVSLRRLCWLRWALLAGQAMLLVSCESIAGIMLPYKPLLFLLSIQTAFNLYSVARLRWHATRGPI